MRRLKRILPAAAILFWLAASPGALCAGASRSRILSPAEPAKDYGFCPLDTDVYAQARPDLMDLRLVDAAGGPVPALIIFTPPEPAGYDCVERQGNAGGEYPRLQEGLKSWPAPVTWPVKVSVGLTEDGRTQTVLLDLHGSVPVDRIMLKISTLIFHRRIELSRSEQGEDWQRVAGMDIYRYKSAGKLREETTLALGRGQVRSRYFRVQINNGADRPLDITDVEVTGRPDVLVFTTPESGGLELFYGAEGKTPPQPDLERILPHLAAGDFSRWNLEPPRPEPETENWIDDWFYPVIIISILVLVGAAAVALKKIGRAPDRP